MLLIDILELAALKAQVSTVFCRRLPLVQIGREAGDGTILSSEKEAWGDWGEMGS